MVNKKRFGPCPHKAHGLVEKTDKKASKNNNYRLLKISKQQTKWLILIISE